MKKRRRIMPRFGMRSILVLTTIVAVVCGGWLREARIQRDVCERLSQVGIEVSLDQPSMWLSWLPKSVLSLGDGHYFCPVTDIDLDVGFNSPLRQKPHNNNFLALISKLSSLKRLKVDCRLVNSKEFPSLAGSRLEELDLRFGDLVDEDVSRLPRMPTLKSLSLSFNSQVTGKYVDVHRFPSLQHLDCSSTELNDLSMIEIGRFSNLKSLNIGSTKVTDVGVAAISSLKKLERIQIDNTQVTGIGIGAVASLESIDLSNTDLVDEAFAEISHLEKLKVLSLSDCVFVTDRGLSALAHHARLQSIVASCCGITDGSTESLATIGSLESLWLDDTRVRSLSKLAACKRLKMLSLSSSEIPVDDAMKFSKHSVCNIQIGDPSNQTEQRTCHNCYGCFGGGPKYLTSAELASMAGQALGGNEGYLVLEGLVGLSAKHFENFGSNITKLSLARSKVQGDLFEYLVNLPVLVSLDLTMSSVTDADLSAIGALQNLTSLELGGTAIDDLGMLEIESLINLTNLSIGKTKVTPESLKVIRRFKQLQSLTLSFVPDAASLLELLEACPSLNSLECSILGSEPAFELMGESVLRLHDIEVTSKQLDRLLELQSQRAGERILVAGRKLNDGHCTVLAKYPHIVELDLSGSSVTDAGIATLGKLPELGALSIENTNVTASGLKSLRANKSLECIICSPQPWSVDWVNELFELKSLREIGLPFSKMPREEAQLFVSELVPAELMCFEGGLDFDTRDYFWQEEMAWMAGTSPFSAYSRRMTLSGSLIDNLKMAEVVSSPAIENIKINNVDCDSDSLLTKLVECTSAKQIQLSGVSLTPGDISKLSKLRYLESLDLDNRNLTQAHIAELAKFPRLSTLVISCDGLELNELSELNKMSRLRKLILKTKGQTEKYEELKQQLGKRCEIVRSTR